MMGCANLTSPYGNPDPVIIPDIVCKCGNCDTAKMYENFEECVVVDGKIYCWDGNEQKVVPTKLIRDISVTNIPEKATNALFEKILNKRRGKANAEAFREVLENS